MAKPDKKPEESTKGSHKTQTMRDIINGVESKVDKKAEVKNTKVSKKTVPPSSKTSKKAPKVNEADEKGFLAAFWWGFTLPLRWIWKALWTILWPVRWLLRHIIPRYFKNSWKELKLVTWPSTKDTIRLTVAVFLFAAVFGAIISGVDLGLDKLFKAVILK